MEPWRSLPYDEEASVALLLAGGDALLAGLAATGQPALRWYRTPTTAVVLGRGQNLQEVDRAACHAVGIAIHRRSSGGTAVLLEPDLLMLDVALPASHPLHLPDVTESYRWLGEVWAAALQRLGLPAAPIAPSEARTDARNLDRLTRRVCFGGYSPYEVMRCGRKTVGLSQVRRREGALLQAGLSLHQPSYRLVSLLALNPDERVVLANRLLERTTGLNDAPPPRRPPANPQPPHLTADQVMTAFAAALRARVSALLVAASWNSEEQAARLQAVSRYAPLEPGRSGQGVPSD
ncbi:MAG: ligase [Chloroflexaceae bacterium]|nr:ligase [Chloroflexaceae bacterium]